MKPSDSYYPDHLAEQLGPLIGQAEHGLRRANLITKFWDTLNPGPSHTRHSWSILDDMPLGNALLEPLKGPPQPHGRLLKRIVDNRGALIQLTATSPHAGKLTVSVPYESYAAPANSGIHISSSFMKLPVLIDEQDPSLCALILTPRPSQRAMYKLEAYEIGNSALACLISTAHSGDFQVYLPSGNGNTFASAPAEFAQTMLSNEIPKYLTMWGTPDN